MRLANLLTRPRTKKETPVPTDLSPYPTEAEQRNADLALALVEWQGNSDSVDAVKALHETALDYARMVPDWFREVPELHAQADRLRCAVEVNRPSSQVSRLVADLLDLVDTYEADRAADAASAAHDAWRGTDFADND